MEILSHYQNAGQDYDIKIVNRSFEIVLQFIYLETTVANQNFELGGNRGEIEFW
jgi:hypothetical protein